MNKVVNFQTPKKEQSHTCEYSGVTFPTSGSEVSKNNLDFGGALFWLKKGYTISRESWNSYPQSRVFIGMTYENDENLSYLYVMTNSGKMVPWIPNYAEMLTAKDWFVR